jgi:hypothetical protein
LKPRCWGPCGGKAGLCAWCGQGNACCRKGFRKDPPICRKAGVKFGSWGGHQCVHIPGPGDTPSPTPTPTPTVGPTPTPTPTPAVGPPHFRRRRSGAWPQQDKAKCSQTNKQKAMYAYYTYQPSLAQKPAKDFTVTVEW